VLPLTLALASLLLLAVALIGERIVLWRVASYLDDTRGVLEVHASSRRWCIVVERGSGRVDWDRVLRAEAWLLWLGRRRIDVKNLTASETFHELSVHLHGPKGAGRPTVAEAELHHLPRRGD